MKELLDSLPQKGKIEWIGLRPKKRADLLPVRSVEVSEAAGLVGDHYSGKSGKRQVTLIQEEHLEAVANLLKIDWVDPGLTRRNIVVSGIKFIGI